MYAVFINSEMLLKKDSKLGEFAEFILRFLPTVASEATVERKLWRQRVVNPFDSFSLSEETQINRVISFSHVI